MKDRTISLPEALAMSDQKLPPMLQSNVDAFMLIWGEAETLGSLGAERLRERVSDLCRLSFTAGQATALYDAARTKE